MPFPFAPPPPPACPLRPPLWLLSSVVAGGECPCPCIVSSAGSVLLCAQSVGGLRLVIHFARRGRPNPVRAEVSMIGVTPAREAERGGGLEGGGGSGEEVEVGGCGGGGEGGEVSLMSAGGGVGGGSAAGTPVMHGSSPSRCRLLSLCCCCCCCAADAACRLNSASNSSH